MIKPLFQVSDLRSFHSGRLASSTQTVALTKIETITLYESWRQNLIYVLSLDKNAANPRRGLTNDGTTVSEVQRLMAVQKNAHLDLLLG